MKVLTYTNIFDFVVIEYVRKNNLICTRVTFFYRSFNDVNVCQDSNVTHNLQIWFGSFKKYNSLS